MCKVSAEQEDGSFTFSHRLRHVVHHSPTGIEIGYGGSGPADSALSVLADYFNEKPSKKQLYYGLCLCWTRHQDLKRELIAGMDSEGGSFTTADIERVLGWL